MRRRTWRIHKEFSDGMERCLTQDTELETSRVFGQITKHC